MPFDIYTIDDGAPRLLRERISKDAARSWIRRNLPKYGNLRSVTSGKRPLLGELREMGGVTVEAMSMNDGATTGYLEALKECMAEMRMVTGIADSPAR